MIESGDQLFPRSDADCCDIEIGDCGVRIGDSVASAETLRLRGRQISSLFGDFPIVALSSGKEKNCKSAHHYDENNCPCEHVVVVEELLHCPKDSTVSDLEAVLEGTVKVGLSSSSVC